MFAQPVRISARATDPLNNQKSTADTITQMGRLADQSAGHPIVQAAVERATAELSPWAEYPEVVECLWHYVHNHVRFATDEATMQVMGIPVWNPTKELLIAPPTLLSMPEPTGDCDDFSMLARAMLRCCGMRMSFVTLKADKSQPTAWSHVYGRAYYPGGSMAFDASHGQWPGWEYPGYWERREWS